MLHAGSIERNGGRIKTGLGVSENNKTPIEEAWAVARADEVLTRKDRVVYAQVENLVKNSEFVLEFPNFHLYLSEPYQGVITSYFNADGIMGKINLQEDAPTHRTQPIHSRSTQQPRPSCRVEYEAKLTESEIPFSLFHFLVKVLVVKDQRQILVASADNVKRRREAIIVSGSSLLIPCADITEKANLLGNGATLRVVLNVEVTFCKQRPTTHSIVGSSGVNKQSDPPFFKPLQAKNDSDVQLICEDETFPVHGIILKNVSHVFRRMLELPMQEAATRQIVVKDLSVETVKRMLEYIYHGRINVGSNAQVVELLYAAEKYEFDLLKAACLERMVTSMSDENVTSFLEISIRLNVRNEIIKQMVDYCMDQIQVLRKREDFQAFARANQNLFLENWLSN